MPPRPACSRPTTAALLLAATACVGFSAASRAADVELVVDFGAGGALSLRSDTGSAFDINAYSIFSAAGLLADTGDETLGGQLSAITFDVDNAGSDEVAMWTLGPAGQNNPDLSLPAALPGLALNLAWIGGAGDDPLTDLTVEYGLSTGQPATAVADVVVLLSMIMGDYNDSGLVEQGDLDLVLSNWGADFGTIPPGWVNQRPTEGIVDQAELDKVLSNWGASSALGFGGFSGAAVPEPASLAAVGALGLGGLRRRPKKSSKFLEKALHKSPRIG